MAKYGRPLLQRLTFQYCDRMGSSSGIREYIEQHLPALKQSVARQIPDLQVVKVVKRNRFPLVKAQYAPLANSSVAHLERELQQASSIQQQARQEFNPSRQQQQQQQQASARHYPFSSNVVGVKHRTAEDIKSVVWWLTQRQGRPTSSRVPNKHIRSRRSSIQGPWTANTFASQ